MAVSLYGGTTGSVTGARLSGGDFVLEQLLGQFAHGGLGQVGADFQGLHHLVLAQAVLEEVLERVEVEEASRRAGLTVGSYARQQMLKAPPPRAVRRPPLERELIAHLLGQVGRVGGNLHQLVRHLNFGREPERREIGEVLGALEMLKREIMQALGRQGRDQEPAAPKDERDAA